MTDLVIHIGLAKCGSTMLQRAVFSQEDGYFGTSNEIAPTNNFAKLLQWCAPVRYKVLYRMADAQNWASRLREAHASLAPNSERILLSDEVLSSPNILSPWPIVRYLKRLDDEVWSEGKVRVIVVLRRQQERMASAYAELSKHLVDAGQNDFERYIRTRVKKTRSLDFSGLVERLYQVFSKERVLVLFLEESHTSEFWNSLVEFAGLKNCSVKERVLDAERKNVRRKSESVWRLQEFDSVTSANFSIDRWMGTLWPHTFLPDVRKRTNSFLVKKVSDSRQRGLDSASGRPREETIELTAELQDLIRQRCSIFNERLAELVERDLGDLGYY